jgi:hypothetical protein
MEQVGEARLCVYIYRGIVCFAFAGNRKLIEMHHKEPS